MAKITGENFNKPRNKKGKEEFFIPSKPVKNNKVYNDELIKKKSTKKPIKYSNINMSKYYSIESKTPSEEKSNIIKCGICDTILKRADWAYTANQETRQSNYLCESCLKNKKVYCCKSCGMLFSDELIEDHCLACIESAPRNYIKSYGERAEKHHNFIISLCEDKKVKFNGEESQKLIGNNAPESFVLNAGGFYATLFGIELEYEVVKDYGLNIIKINNLMNSELEKENGLRAIIKRDGTLRDKDGNENGFEIVSAPADKKYHYKAWDNFLDTIKNNDSYHCAPYCPPQNGAERGTGCGCHIHISKDSMVHHNNYGGRLGSGYGLACAKLQTFIYSKNNRKFIEVMAGRKSNMFSNFTQKRGAQLNNQGKIVLARSVRENLGMDHRTAVNFHSSNGRTIEFRIFRSTKDKNELKKNIDFVDAICCFCRTGNASLNEMNDWIYFYEFVLKNRQDYPYLYRFFEGVKDFNGGETHPPDEKFAQLLHNKLNKIAEPNEVEAEEVEEILPRIQQNRPVRLNELVARLNEEIIGQDIDLIIPEQKLVKKNKKTIEDEVFTDNITNDVIPW